MKYSMRSVNPDGTMPGDGLLNDYVDLSVNMTFSDVGDVQFSYPVSGANVGRLVQQREIAVFDETGEVPDTRFILEDRNGNLVHRDGVLYRSWQGRNLYKVFEEAIVYPSDWPTNPSVTAGTQFASATPGNILSALINASQARGELPGITYNFTNTLTSAGTAWGFTLSIDYAAGVNLLQVMQNLIDQGVVEFRMVGRQLQAYNINQLGTDRSVGASQLAIWAARNVLEVPEQEVSRGLRNVALIKGEENRFLEYVDATSVGAWGRRPMFISQGGVTDNGTLTVIAQANIDRVKQPRRERTTQFTITPDLIPQRAFAVGDWILSDSGEALEKMRVRQAIIKADSGDIAAECTVVLNDKFMELEIILSRKVEGITGGATLGGGSSGIPTDPDSGGGGPADTLAPKIPAGLSVTSSAYVDQAGAGFAAMTASWLQVTQNADNSTIEDLENYVVAWQNVSGDWVYEWVDGSTTKAFWSPVFLGQVIPVKVGAYDRSGNFSGWSATVTHTAVSDTTPPPVPKAPTVTAWLGTLRIDWDGTGAASEAMPADLKFVEVHISTVNNFTPTTATMIDQMIAKGRAVASGLVYGTTYYVKLVAVDTTGNRSAASAQATGIPAAIVGNDIQPGSISFADIAFKDLNNIIPDGSFENSAVDADRVGAPSTAPFTYLTDTPFHDARYLRLNLATNPSTTRALYLTDTIPVRSGDTFWCRAAFRRSAGIVGTSYIAAVWTLQAGTTSTVTFVAGSLAPANGVWTEVQNTIVAPANAKTVRFYVGANTDGTAGTHDVDAVEVRPVIGTSLIQDLAVNNAKIADLSVGKLTAGTLLVDVTVSGRIKTANTGARVEMNGLGIQAYNSAGSRIVDIDTSGNVDIAGMLRTGLSGKRIEMNPAAGNPEHRYYPAGAGGRYAYLQGYDQISTASGIRLASARTGLDDASGIQSVVELDYDANTIYLGNQTGTIQCAIDMTRVTGEIFLAGADLWLDASGAINLDGGAGGIWLACSGVIDLFSSANDIFFTSNGGQVHVSHQIRAAGDIYGNVFRGTTGAGATVNATGDTGPCSFHKTGGQTYVWDHNRGILCGPL